MSILDQAINDMKAAQESAGFAEQMIGRMLPALDENVREILEASRGGLAPGDVVGVTRDQKEALLDLGCRLTQLERLDDAAAVLLRLVQFDPLEERALYALGVVCQLRGEPEKAVRLYLQFLALDATNPLGYLRLGECLLAAGDHPQAHDAFLSARAVAEGDPAHAGALAQARSRLALPQFETMAVDAEPHGSGRREEGRMAP